MKWVIEMNKIRIKFSSVTYALKGKSLLEKSGHKVFVNKNVNPGRNEGCGYSLTVSGNVSHILTLLELNRIKYLSYELIK